MSEGSVVRTEWTPERISSAAWAGVVAILGIVLGLPASTVSPPISPVDSRSVIPRACLMDLARYFITVPSWVNSNIYLL